MTKVTNKISACTKTKVRAQSIAEANADGWKWHTPHRNLRERTRTFKRDGGPALLDCRSKPSAIDLGNSDDRDRNCGRIIITFHFLRWSVLVVVDDDSGRAGILRIHRLLEKWYTTGSVLDQHNLPIGSRVHQLGRAVQRLSEDDLCISEFQTRLLRPKVCCRRLQGAASPRDAYYARTDNIT